MVNVGEVWRAQLVKSSLLTSTLEPLGFFRSFKVCSDAREGVGCGKLPHLFVPSKIATLVPEFAVDDLTLNRSATLVPEFAVTCPWAEHPDNDNNFN